MDVVISRYRHYPRPARPGPAWYWNYEINCGAELLTADSPIEEKLWRSSACGTLFEARRIAGKMKTRFGAERIVETWK